MAALLTCLLTLTTEFQALCPTNGFHLQFPPPVTHHVLDSNQVQKYREIFVIGDVHGCHDELNELLQKADVLGEKSLKVFVGDLVDKGPKNRQVVEQLRTMPSTLSVRGNCDDLVLREYVRSLNGTQSSGYEWVREFSEDDIRFLSNLPYTLSIPSIHAIIVHAGLVPGVPIQCQDPEIITNMRNVIINESEPLGLRATHKGDVGQAWASQWVGPNHIYFGHDSKKMLQIYPCATGLDTGCVYGKWMTGMFISGPRKGILVSVKAKQIYKKRRT